ncbi:MAG: hypothetical protein RMY64_10800 [Nostoc sp. DedQUE08]|uniref:hypothetical protein n=1 Tax=Nostoc sp. DedQUE08 TaxID=3075393 RepID=UPI002AD43060|nr:hypothetical protein [Nostoc sp. DedQUE08]MDZ8066109.1 hypothetical protein [Nostoc sp. DedQUE08]
MSNLTVQAPVDAPLVNLSESVATEEINSSNTYHVPVVWKQVKKLIEMMKQVGVEWDGTINHLDSFHVKYRTAFDVDLYWAWRDLTPKKSHKRSSLVYAPYTE